MKETIWGLDLGTTSIGFAVVEYDAEKHEGEIIRMGVRIFPEGVTEKEMEPRNKRRRDKRLLRRQLRRRKQRRVELSKVMADVGLLPAYGSSEWDSIMNTDPYLLRSEGLTRKLTPFETGRALYNLTQHRGFKITRKTVVDETKEGDVEETGIVKTSIEELRKEMQGLTLGQHLHSESAKKRGRYIGRQMVEDEFNKLWEAQAKYHPAILSDELKTEIGGIAFMQRPTFWRLETLGTCHLEPDSQLCLKSSWAAQRFLMLQDVNALKLSTNNDVLPADQRELIIEKLSRQNSMTWGGVRKLLKPLWQKAGTPLRSTFNFETGGKDKLPGNVTEAKLQAVFGEGWKNHTSLQLIRDEIPQKLWDIEYRRIGNKKVVIKGDAESAEARKDFIAFAQQQYAISGSEARLLSELTLPQGWLSHSDKAIKKLLPHLEQGRMYSEACDRVYPGHRDIEGEGLSKLPSDQQHLKHVPNPTVKRALNELRKVVNNLISLYGKPDKIKVELLRDLKMSSSGRRDYQTRIKKQENERKKAKEDLELNGILDPDRKTIEKWLLWKECGEECIYTEAAISFNDLFIHGRFDIEHILPRSISLDNGYMNKTIGEKDFNQHKGNRIPFEAFPDQESWDSFHYRVMKSKLPSPKIRKLTAKRLEDALGEDFSERQLRDSSYIATEARKFLMKLFKKEEGRVFPVETTNGMITAQLRGFWGLNTLLNEVDRKTRDDHRHHAVDALTVALVSRGNVKHLSDLHKYRMQGRRWEFPDPWKNFRNDADDKVKSLIVSHKVNAKVSGQLHNEMFFSDTGRDRVKSGTTYGLYTRRVDLKGLSKSKLQNLLKDKEEIVWDNGERNKRVVLAHLEKHKDFKEYPTFTLPDGTKRKIKHIKILQPKQRSIVAALGPGSGAHVDKDENHHMVIYETPEENIAFKVVSRFDAAMRLSKHQPVIQRVANTGRFLLSICIGDTIFIPANLGKGTIGRYVIVKSIWESGVLVCKDINDATKGQEGVIRPNPNSLLNTGAEKVSIDPIGRTHPKND